MVLRQLRYFVAVGEELHLRRAAKRLHVAQLAVSEQELELDLGVQLFERTNRRASPTDAGLALLDEARRVLRQTKVARQAARGATERTAMRLHIGYLPDAPPAAVPRAPRRLAPSSSRREGRPRKRARVVPRRRCASIPLGDQGPVLVLPTLHPHAVERERLPSRGSSTRCLPSSRARARRSSTAALRPPRARGPRANDDTACGRAVTRRRRSVRLIPWSR